MVFFKKFINKFNKKAVVKQQENNIFEQDNYIKEIEYFDINALPEVQQISDIDCGYECNQKPASQEWLSSSTTKQEETYEFNSSLAIKQENHSDNSNNFKNLISDKFFYQLFLFFIILIIPSLLVRVFFFFVIIVVELKPILMRLELSKEDYDYMLDPFQILFTQAQINSYFSGDDGFTVEDTINDLISGSLKVKDLPTIRVCLNKNDQYISADNRPFSVIKKQFEKVLTLL